MRGSFRLMIVVGLLFLVAAWLAGPGRRALTARGWLAPGLQNRVWAYVVLAVVGLFLLFSAQVVDFTRLLVVAPPRRARRHLDRAGAPADAARVPGRAGLDALRGHAGARCRAGGSRSSAAPEAPPAAPVAAAATDVDHAARRRSPTCMRRARSPTRSSPPAKAQRPRRQTEAGSPPCAPNIRGVDSDLAQALVAAAIWVVVLVAVRMSLRHVFDRYERRLAETRPGRRGAPADDVQLSPPCRRSRSSGSSAPGACSRSSRRHSRSRARSSPRAPSSPSSPASPSRRRSATSARASCSPSRSRFGSATGSPSTTHTGIVDEISLSYTALDDRRGAPDLRPEHDAWSRRSSSTAPSTTRGASSPSSCPSGSARRSATRGASSMEAAADGAAGREPRDLRPGRRR